MSAVKGIAFLLSPKTTAHPLCLIYSEYEVQDNMLISYYYYTYIISFNECTTPKSAAMDNNDTSPWIGKFGDDSAQY